ncbi:hypothetical protein AVEN_43128-1 [Araneus ventricosus]|uniref:Uncharacterized protein n=1 Tax=Araneus ventricosus TaxID=182803 RepID=A0A4Y2VGC1_ARAVE|nr:hypothetical protein AVEN_43128-1 [Araneus ventricosus]
MGAYAIYFAMGPARVSAALRTAQEMGPSRRLHCERTCTTLFLTQGPWSVGTLRDIISLLQTHKSLPPFIVGFPPPQKGCPASEHPPFLSPSSLPLFFSISKRL